MGLEEIKHTEGSDVLSWRGKSAKFSYKAPFKPPDGNGLYETHFTEGVPSFSRRGFHSDIEVSALADLATRVSAKFLIASQFI